MADLSKADLRKADLHKGEPWVSWLETELARQLCPISAPDSLWRQIHEQRRPLRVRPRYALNREHWAAWSLATAALLMLSAGLVWLLGMTRDSSVDLETLAGRELRGLANGTGKIDIRSSDPREIQTWVKANADIDVQLPDHAGFGNEGVRLLGARMFQFRKLPVALIAYRTGDAYAAMLVSDRHAASPRHASLSEHTSGDVMLYSWSQGADDYAIAFGGMKEPRRPCLLCHVDPAALIIR